MSGDVMGQPRARMRTCLVSSSQLSGSAQAPWPPKDGLPAAARRLGGVSRRWGDVDKAVTEGALRAKMMKKKRRANDRQVSFSSGGRTEIRWICVGDLLDLRRSLTNTRGNYCHGLLPVQEPCWTEEGGLTVQCKALAVLDAMVRAPEDGWLRGG